MLIRPIKTLGDEEWTNQNSAILERDVTENSGALHGTEITGHGEPDQTETRTFWHQWVTQ
jgi:hypothetical protein